MENNGLMESRPGWRGLPVKGLDGEVWVSGNVQYLTVLVVTVKPHCMVHLEWLHLALCNVFLSYPF